MKILKPLISEFQGLLENSNINEEIDIKISSIESFDYQINNLVKYQNHKDIEKILNDVEELALNVEIIDSVLLRFPKKLETFVFFKSSSIFKA